MIKLIASQVSVDAAAGETGRREITGIAVPYGVAATVSDGTSVIFQPGSLPVDGKAPRLFMYHDASMPVGIVTERVDTPEGMMFTAKISASTQGQDAMIMLQETVIDQVSVGVNPRKFSYDEDGTMIIESADWTELSLEPIGAFGDMANIATVAASIPQPEQDLSTIETEPTQETETMSEVTPVEAVEATIPTAPLYAQAKRTFAMPSAAEYLAAYHAGGEVFRKVNDAFIIAQGEKQTALQAAAGDTTTSNTPGLLPVPVLGPVFENLNQYMRPVVQAVGARSMPDGGNQKTFIRPTWTTHTSVAAQAAELDAVSATTPVIASNVISKTTLSGQVTLSIQDVDFTSPAAMQIILTDLIGQYMQASDNVAADAITAGASASGATWTINQTDPSSLITALYGAAVNIMSATNFMPDTVFVSPNVWELLGRQLDVDKRPVFGYVGAAGLMGVNGLGGANITQMSTFNPLGLRLVADRNFASNTLVVARSQAIEFYEQVRGLMSLEVPGSLGRLMSYYSYVATFIGQNTQVQSIALA
jgi:HK97 family phage prohead protease